MFCLFADSVASNAPFVAKLNALEKAVKNSRHVAGSLRDELYLLSDLYDKLALCSLELYKFDFGNDEEIVFQAGEILSGSDWSKGNVEESDLRSNFKADVLAVQGQMDDISTKRMKLLACEVSSLRRKLKGNKRANKKKTKRFNIFHLFLFISDGVVPARKKLRSHLLWCLSKLDKNPQNV